MITIYTDGSSRGNPGPGGWAGVILFPDSVIEVGGRESHTTNNRMELMGAIYSLKLVKSRSSIKNIEIYTDSQYVMKGITVWIKEWQVNNWKTASKKTVSNQDLWKELLVIVSNLSVDWKYVAGHSGHELNERCDEIATSFADNRAPLLYNGKRSDYGLAN